MAANITKLTPVEVGERFRFDPDEILEEAKGQPFTTICVLGQLADGTIYIAGSANAGASARSTRAPAAVENKALSSNQR
jgi:hypothetical protein